MARIDTLANFLTDVATAIKNKTGKTNTITPANFDTEINSIEVGGGSNENILPDGYIQLEYIASDGTQIIDTGFQPTEKTEFEITFSTQNELVYSGDFGSIFGARYTYNAGGYQLATFAPGDGGAENIGAFMFGDVFHSGYLKNDGSVQTVTFKNGLYTGGNGGTKDLSSITSVNTLGNLYLFACYETSANNTVDPGKMTLYSCRFEENGQVIRHFVPAKRTSDSALGLYDFVTERFFMSDRGNSFKAGPEKVINNGSTGEQTIKKMFSTDDFIQEGSVYDMVGYDMYCTSNRSGNFNAVYLKYVESGTYYMTTSTTKGGKATNGFWYTYKYDGSHFYVVNLGESRFYKLTAGGYISDVSGAGEFTRAIDFDEKLKIVVEAFKQYIYVGDELIGTIYDANTIGSGSEGSASDGTNFLLFKDFYKEVKIISNNNVFIQEEEPENKNGVWVKTANYTSKDITVATESDITFGESGWAATGTYANLPQGNGYACAAELDGKMYFGGGHQNNKLFEYDMDTNVYTELPNIPYNFGWGGMNGYNGELYIFGGKHATTTAYKYNPTTQTYTQLADIPVGFVSAISVTLGDKIYLVTGRPFESSSTRYNTIYEYNPADDTYKLCNATIHNGDCKGAIGYKGYLYIFGSDQENRTCYRYNPRTDTSKKMGSIPFDCTDTYACATDDAIYLVGSSGSPYALWKYEPGADKYTQLPDTPISTWGPASGALLKGKYLFAIGDTINHNKVQVYTISDKTYINTPANGLLIDQYDKSIETMFTDPIKSLFSTVKYYANGEEINAEIYYGDGTDWIKL